MNLSRRELTILGASIYLCEGTKARVDNRGWSHFDVEFTNKDPRLICLFLKFLRKSIKVEENRLKAQLFVYPDHDQHQIMLFWSKATAIPFDRFNKTILLKQKNPRYIPNPLGTLKLRYSHKKHFLKIQSIINDIFEQKGRGARVV